MNKNRLFGFAVAAVVLGLLVFAAWSLFEILPETRHIGPSREARMNEYLALDRWLGSSGILARTQKSGNLPMIIQAKENHIFIQAALFEWSREAVEYFTDWIENGGTLFLVLERNPNIIASSYYYVPSPEEFYGEEVLALLEEFGITVNTEVNEQLYHFDTEYPYAPTFDDNVSFEMSDEDDYFALMDWAEVVRLVQVKRGKGKLIVSGRPRFLLSQYIGEEYNAYLSWKLFAADWEGVELSETDFHRADLAPNGWLFIRGELKARGVLGNLWRQGNFAVLIVSVLTLLVIGFWAVIPVFGVIRDDKEKPGKSLRERFLAEGRFLKRNGALAHYIRVYIKEIKKRLVRKEGPAGDDEMEKKILSLMGSDEEKNRALLTGVFRGAPFRHRDFLKVIIILNKILERI